MFQFLFSFIQQNTLWVLEFILMFSALIVIHEFGHYWMAKKSGVVVHEFALGFGKKIYGKKIGETEFNINLVPFGGFVRMLGEEETSDEKGSFGQAKLWQRMAITLGGPFMNFVTAIVLLTILFSIGNKPILINQNDSRQTYENGYWGLEDSEGNLLTAQNTSWEKLLQQKKIKKGALKEAPLKEIKLTPFNAFIFSIGETGRVSKGILSKVSEIPQTLLKTKKLPEGMAGPLGIAEVTKKVSTLGFKALLLLSAMLSISLGVMNLLPIPALDGGRFFFQIIEMLLIPFRTKINENIENYSHVGGFFILIGFLILVTIEDVHRMFFS